MRPKPRLFIISAVILIAVLAIVLLPRRDKTAITPDTEQTVLASSAISPAASAVTSPAASPSVPPAPSIDPIDVFYYQELISGLTDRNQILREDLYEATHLVNLENMDSSMLIDLRYATSDNFTDTVLYPISICLLREETAQKLIKAEARFEALGYRIKIWDAYRPLSVQQIMYDATEDKAYIANPENGSRHNRGAAVDITLVDAEDNELEMPSGFDDFSINAHRDNPDMPETAKKNMDVLTSVMTECGFTSINSEWWHFDDSDWQSYPVLDIHLESFAE
jgi:D-alanyl-D-alanine dipeptidase